MVNSDGELDRFRVTLERNLSVRSFQKRVN